MLGVSDILTKRVIPAISTQTYSSGFQVGSGAFKIPSIAPDDAWGIVGYNVLVLDGSKQNASFDLLFFDSEPTILSNDRQLADISLENAKGKLIAIAQVTNYLLLANISIGFANFCGWAGQPKYGVDLWCLPIIRNVATYSSTTALEFTFGAVLGKGR